MARLSLRAFAAAPAASYNGAPMANRYFLPELPPAGPFTLAGELAHHLGHVLRVRAGEELVLGDGRGGTAHARVLGRERGTIAIVVDRRFTAPEPPRRLLLAFATPRLARAEWLLEHGTEVGITWFQPLATERVRPQGDRPERWARLVLAAAGQCDRPYVPSVRPTLPLADFLAEPSLPPLRFLTAEGAPPLAAEPPIEGDVAVLVGPEGGLTEAEAALTVARGFVPRGLGPHVLRTETAALVAAALLLAR